MSGEVWNVTRRGGTPSVEVKRVRKGLIAKELASGRCGKQCVSADERTEVRREESEN